MSRATPRLSLALHRRALRALPPNHRTEAVRDVLGVLLTFAPRRNFSRVVCWVKDAIDGRVAGQPASLVRESVLRAQGEPMSTEARLTAALDGLAEAAHEHTALRARIAELEGERGLRGAA